MSFQNRIVTHIAGISQWFLEQKLFLPEKEERVGVGKERERGNKWSETEIGKGRKRKGG